MIEIGECKIKKPNFLMCIDKDDTVNLNDKQLNNTFNLITTMGGMVVFVTGRTTGDIESELRKKKIKVPEIIVGDNGAVIRSTSKKVFLEKKLLEKKKVMSIINEFNKNGGNVDNIRYTDGVYIYASKQKEVEAYYKRSQNVVLYDDIYQMLQQTEDITKLTLAGSKEQMQQMAEYIKELDFWTDMDSTKFPSKKHKNYRLDIAQKNINKGEAVKWLVKMLKPRYGYACIGNGYNDIPMFKVAIDNGMIAAIVSKASPELKEEMTQYFKSKNKGKLIILPEDENLANNYILKEAKKFQTYIKTEERKRTQKEKRLPNVPRVKVKNIYQKNISRGIGSKRKNIDR